MIRKSLMMFIVLCMLFALAACGASPEGLATDKFKQEQPDLKIVKVQPVYAKTVLLNNDISESCSVNVYYNENDYISYAYKKTNGQWVFAASASSTD